jgi:hypothetical protein
MHKLLKNIRIGDYAEAVIYVITFGFGEKLALSIARLMGKTSCGCCERKEWLNKLTDKNYKGNCNQIKL